MALINGFFNSEGGDRKYNADIFADYFASFIGNGVFPNPSNNMQVMETGKMQVKVRPGKAWINGYFAFNTADYTLVIDNADGVLNRRDRVVLRWSKANRDITLAVKKGSFASRPTAPGLTRNSEIYELGLAEILVNAGDSEVSQVNIVDTRLSRSYCGLVTATVQSVDVTTLFNQYQSGFESKKDDFEGLFYSWYNNLKNNLDSNQASNLMGLIMENRQIKDLDTNKTYEYSLTNENGHLTINYEEV